MNPTRKGKPSLRIYHLAASTKCWIIQQNEATNHMKRQAEFNARTKALSPPQHTPIKMARMLAFVDPRLSDKVKKNLKRAMLAQGIVNTSQRRRASLFVVQDLSDMGQRNQWEAVLRGCVVATPKYVRSAGTSGFVTAYRPPFASVRGRSVWVSAEFVDSHSTLHEILEAAMRGSNSKMLSCSQEEFLQTRSRTRQCRNPIALVTIAQKRSEANRI